MGGDEERREIMGRGIWRWEEMIKREIKGYRRKGRDGDKNRRYKLEWR